MMEEQIRPIDVAKKYGLIYALASTVVNLTPILLENTDQSLGFLVNILNVGLALTIFILAGREFKRENGGYMTFGEAFRINMIAVLIMGLTRSVIIYLYVKVIDTGYSERIMSVMEETWEAQGLNADQIEQAKGFSSLLINPESMIVMTVLSAILGGLIWGAIAGAITKNDQDDF